jgi:hypothetical protein
MHRAAEIMNQRIIAWVVLAFGRAVLYPLSARFRAAQRAPGPQNLAEKDEEHNTAAG